MKSVLISIQPQWCELIASGKKTINEHLVFGDVYRGGKVITRPPQSWCYVEEVVE